MYAAILIGSGGFNGYHKTVNIDQGVLLIAKNGLAAFLNLACPLQLLTSLYKQHGEIDKQRHIHRKKNNYRKRCKEKTGQYCDNPHAVH